MQPSGVLSGLESNADSLEQQLTSSGSVPALPPAEIQAALTKMREDLRRIETAIQNGEGTSEVKDFGEGQARGYRLTNMLGKGTYPLLSPGGVLIERYSGLRPDDSVPANTSEGHFRVAFYCGPVNGRRELAYTLSISSRACTCCLDLAKGKTEIEAGGKILRRPMSSRDLAAAVEAGRDLIEWAKDKLGIES